MGVYMMITNKSDTVVEREFARGPNDFGTHWTPYALRGLEAGSNSLGYDSASCQSSVAYPHHPDEPAQKRIRYQIP